jgi:two-component system chemotaxis sensor kinase CheA
MTTQDVVKQAEEIAESLVFMDLDDPASLKAVVESLDELGRVLEGEGNLGAAAAAHRAAEAGRVLSAGGDPAALVAAVEDLQRQTDSPVDSPLLESDSIVDDQIVSEFLSRQKDVLTEIEETILGFEEGASASEAEGLKRWIHTLKGEAGLLGLSDVADLCHATEDMMQAEQLWSCVDRLLAVKDWLQARFESLARNTPPPVPAQEIIATLAATASAAEPEPELAPEPTPEEPAPVAPAVEANVAPPDYTRVNLLAGDVGLTQDFINESNEHLDTAEGLLLTLEANPRETEALNAVFRGFHSIKGLAGFCALEHIKELAHKAENLLDLARRGEINLADGAMDLVFESVDTMKRLVAGVTVALATTGYTAEEPRLAGLIARLGVAASGQPAPAASAAKEEPKPASSAGRSGFIPLSRLKKPASPAASVCAPAPLTAAPDENTSNVGGVKIKEAMRVDAERLDRLIDTIGELVIAETMVSQSPDVRGNLSVKLSKDLDHLDKISRELQEIGMSLRMVPVRPVFQKMARLVRDLAKKTNRQIEFVMVGEDTELDKNVVDRIGDPLVHMVRNAVDHGIEDSAEARRAAGKPDVGRIELHALHRGGSIIIEIKDDGRGLDKQRILQKAYDRGLLREGEVPPDRDIYNLIFEPGFSTAKTVTDISGRGVGMDVVRRNVEELRGTCEIQSEAGKGSLFCIKLPLTLAIIDGMVVSCGREHYIIPTLSVVRLVRPQAEDISQVFDRGEMIAFADEHLSLVRLHRLFNLPGARTEPTDAVVVVVEDEGKRLGVLADELLGQQSIVIKSLGESMQNAPGVAGAAIMANGNVALILDVAGLNRLARNSDLTAG